MSQQPLVKLHDGNLMPQLGLGVWQATIEQATQAIIYAYQQGYRAVDTATLYQNEQAIGQAIQQGNLDRQSLFVTTKVWNDKHHDVARALQTSLEKMQLDYVDLYLLHWPVPSANQYVTAWQSMIKLQQQGLIKSIGVCNCNQPHLQRIISETGVVPVINQIEIHPLFQQTALRHWCQQQQIQVESWSPLAQGGKGVFDHPTILQLAEKYHKTPAQIVIRWHIDNQLIVIPKSITPHRIRENFSVFDFQLTDADLTAIAQIDKQQRLGPDPETFVDQ